MNGILEKSEALDKYELAEIFLEKFDLLDSRVLPVIWKWKTAKSLRGISDEAFDEAIIMHMRSAGYDV
ncbi:hypothetical protein [Stenotrophomonas sp. 59]|uniref:hypothetical protein n=1 Tax=Stenotrophomonas sp. 59 TaxID=3051120 RepID=UPI00256EA54A|nr:hypothetical protein [Stenotrophomonas sp. 59]